MEVQFWAEFNSLRSIQKIQNRPSIIQFTLQKKERSRFENVVIVYAGAGGAGSLSNGSYLRAVEHGGGVSSDNSAEANQSGNLSGFGLSFRGRSCTTCGAPLAKALQSYRHEALDYSRE